MKFLKTYECVKNGVHVGNRELGGIYKHPWELSWIMARINWLASGFGSHVI
jgi:hypothetical protein